MRFTTNELNRFCLFEEQILVGTITFRIDSIHNVHIIERVVIEPEFQNQGYGTLLMDTYLKQLHRKEVRIAPQCPYAIHYLHSHPTDNVDWLYNQQSK
ncbi:MAG: GNAT family N-acetyltransferase [Culicoidibacterales bacterium]